jgi:hypothetical protein
LRPEGVRRFSRRTKVLLSFLFFVLFWFYRAVLADLSLVQAMSGGRWVLRRGTPQTGECGCFQPQPVFHAAGERVMRVLCGVGLLVAVLGGAGTGKSDTYWIAWEGEGATAALPEECGWSRNWGNWSGQFEGPGAYRTLENGVLTYDSLYDPGVFDFSYMNPGWQVDPELGEMLVMEWRLKVDAVTGWYRDPDVCFPPPTPDPAQTPTCAASSHPVGPVRGAKNRLFVRAVSSAGRRIITNGEVGNG